MRKSEKLERAGWVFKEYINYWEVYERKGETVIYGKKNDTIVSWEIPTKVIVPDAIQLDILFEK